MKKKYQSTKIFDGFSTVFRQWKAEKTHCKFLHGYGIKFKVTFEGELDDRNWVWDFGGMKRAKNKIDVMTPKEWMDYMFDHTVLIANDDPQMQYFEHLNQIGVIQLRVMEGAVGAEKFAEFIYTKLNDFVSKETQNRVKVIKVEFFENERNSAIFE